ncbi:MAG: DNA-processing protein DprA [Actinomycetota bacterium]
MSALFGIEETILLPMLERLCGDLPRDQLEHRFALATWTGIAEPGDRIAGLVVTALGASAALRAIVERRDAEWLLAALTDAGEDSVANDDIVAAIERWQPRLKASAAVTALRQAARYSVRLHVPGDETWPVSLDDLGPHAPLALWARGNDSTLATLGRSIALVGARAATGYGEHVTMEASAGLVDRGYTIVSGAAYGIDGMAHRAALASAGQTVAFLAGGVDRFYPSGHDALLTRIVADGAVVSELPCGSPPTKWRFLLRNRLIAAASLATIVLEAGSRSGSLNTAGHAADLGRPLGAVPGPVTSAASAGCHRLIRDFQATLVTGPGEMAELAPLGPIAYETSSAGGSPERTRVIDALSTRAARTVDDIAARSGLSVAGVQSVLAVLELEGHATENDRGWLTRADKPSS